MTLRLLGGCLHPLIVSQLLTATNCQLRPPQATWTYQIYVSCVTICCSGVTTSKGLQQHTSCSGYINNGFSFKAAEGKLISRI